MWVAPYTTPIALLVLHVPSLLITGAFSLRARGGILLPTVVLTGLLVGVGEARREELAVEPALVPHLPLLTGGFTAVVAILLVVGVRDQMLRLAHRTADLRASRRRVSEIGFETRRAIERDLHDGAQQRLTTLAVDLGRVQRLWADDPERARAIVAGMRGQLQEAIQELRDLAHGIYPALLGEQGLAGALPAVARRTTVPCVVDLHLAGRYPPTSRRPSTSAASRPCTTPTGTPAPGVSRSRSVTTPGRPAGSCGSGCTTAGWASRSSSGRAATG